MKAILAIDQGTTGTTAILINSETMEFIGKVNKEYPQIYPKPGWVEHNLNDIWESVRTSILELLANNKFSPSDIITIGITNQRETICPFTKNGEPISNAIVWQDRRTEEFCHSIDAETRKAITLETGLPVDPYFSGTKIKWLIENDHKVKEEIKNQNCYFGTIDTFLIYKLTGNKSFFTEPSNASRTLLYNLKEGDWSSSLLDKFNVPSEALPKIKDSFGLFGHTYNLDFLPNNISITGVLGDQQAALFGQAGISKGDSKCTYGTGAFYLMNTGDQLQYSDNGLLTTIAYRQNGKDYFALEGSCYIAGAAVQWLRDNLSFFESSPEVEDLARKATDESMKNIMFLPYFSGLGTPYWKSDAQAAIVGLTRDSGKEQISRACLEGICLSINELIEVFEKDSGIKASELKVDGGAVSNELLNQMQANFSNITIIKPVVIETTAFGAAAAAAIGKDLFNKEELPNLWKQEKAYTARPTDYNASKIKQWKSLINSLYLSNECI